MKKIISTLLLAALGSSLFAQGDVFDATFLTFSYQNPILKWGKLEDRTGGDNLKKFYQNRYNAKTFGMALESGTTFFFHSFEPTAGLKFAIVWDFLDLGMNLFRYNDETYKVGMTNSEIVKCYDLYANYSMNVGPMITFSPVQGFCIDLYGKWRPTVGINAYRQLFFGDPQQGNAVQNKIYTSEPDQTTFLNPDGSPKINKDKQEEIRIGGSLGTISCGLNLRYEFVMIGVEYITGKMTYASSDFFPKQKMWNQMVRFKLGLVFNDKY